MHLRTLQSHQALRLSGTLEALAHAEGSALEVKSDIL